MALVKEKVTVTLKLPQLQNLIKRDPEAYQSEFMMQKRHFENEMEIFKLRPTMDHDRFTELVTFMSHVCCCYKKECSTIPSLLLNLLECHAAILHSDVRAKILQALIMFRNRSMIEPLILIRLSLQLFGVGDKAFRMSLVEYIFNDIKLINQHKRNEKLNRAIQAVIFKIIGEDVTIIGRKTIRIVCELYRRKVWVDSRTVNIIGEACVSPSTRVAVTAMKFFLGIEMQMHEDEEDGPSSLKKIGDIDYHAHSKKTKKRQRHVQKQVERSARLRKELENKDTVSTPLFPAIQMLHDPQSLAEKLFKKLKQASERFEVKLVIINFVSRLIGCHQLLILSFYSYLQRYLTSHQAEVTHILAYTVQACHDLVPPEDVLPIIKAIAHNFISERCSNEVICIGINTIREIFIRVPTLLKEPDMDAFVQDLAMYSHKTHKSVMIAAHSVVNLVREIYPALLRKKDRGKYHNEASCPADYGNLPVATGVDGVELLEAFENNEVFINSDDEVVWNEDSLGAEENIGGQRDYYCDDGDDDDDDDDVDDDDDDDDDDDQQEEEEQEEEEVDDNEEEEEEEEERDGGGGEEWADMDGSNSDSVEEEDDKSKIVNARRLHEDQMSSSRSSRLDATRVLTDSDFALIAKLRAAQLERALDPRNRSKSALLMKDKSSVLKRKREADENQDESGPAYAVDKHELAPSSRTEKSSKIDRIKNVLEGRKDERFEHNGHAGGLTNKEKMRKKNFVMVRKGKRSLAGKSRKSNSERRFEKNSKRDQMGRDKRKRRRT